MCCSAGFQACEGEPQAKPPHAALHKNELVFKHIYTGDMDTYYLDVGVVLLDEWMQQTTDPHYPGFFMYGDRQPHCWSGPVTQAERLREMAQFVLRKQPEGVTAAWWGY